MPLPRRCISQPMQDLFSSQMNWQTTGIWLILGQPWALFLATKFPAHLVPFSEGQMGSQSPLGASSKIQCNFKANFSHPIFKSRCGRSHARHWFFEKIQGHCCQRSTKYSLLALQRSCPPPICLQWPRPPCHICLAFHRLQLQFQPAAATSSQPPALSAHEVWNPEVKSSSFSSRKNQSLLDPPPLLKKYLILCLLMSKPYCKNSPLFFAPGMWSWHQPMGSRITSAPVVTPYFLQNPAASIRKSCKLPNQSSKG